jgi:uncharacterized protein
VGLCGVSYYAMSQWLAAARQPPHLAAILVWEGAHDFYRDVTYHGGILSNVFTRRWYERRVVANQHGQGERGLPDCGVGGLAAGPRTHPEDQLAARRADLVTAIRDHPLDDGFHRARTAELSQITVPLLSAANWAGFGLHAGGNFSGFTGAASAHKWLQMHGGRHKEWFYLPESLTLPRRFFDCFLKGAGNDWLAAPQIQLHIRRLGERFQLRTEHEWPLARTRWTDLCLDAATHRMHDERPESQSSFTFAALGQGVTFRTGPLSAQTELTGPVAAVLYVSSSTADADIFVTLQAFLADGGEVVFDGASEPAAPLAQGCLRLSHRHTDPARPARWQPFHTHDRIDPAQPGRSTASTSRSGPPASSCPPAPPSPSPSAGATSRAAPPTPPPTPSTSPAADSAHSCTATPSTGPHPPSPGRPTSTPAATPPPAASSRSSRPIPHCAAPRALGGNDDLPEPFSRTVDPGPASAGLRSGRGAIGVLS